MREQSLQERGLAFNVSQLLKEGTGSRRSYLIDDELTSDLSDRIRVDDVIGGEITVINTGRSLLVNGELTTIVQQSECGRCLDPFSSSMSVLLEEEFFPTINIGTGHTLSTSAAEEPANKIDEQHILDLTEVLRQELLLTAESYRYCKPSCLGLCLKCGKNRNIEPCTCDIETIDSRWSGLLNMRNRLELSTT